MVQIAPQRPNAPVLFNFKWSFRVALLVIGLICLSIISSVDEAGSQNTTSLTQLWQREWQSSAYVQRHDLEQRSSPSVSSTKITSVNQQTHVSSNNTTRTIGYAVVITGCASTDNKAETPFPIAEGGAVLQHSIASATGRYNNYQLYAIHHPNASECASTLAPLGFTLLERDTPVAVADIQGDFLREKIVKNGCCGEKELIKFEAFTLTQHEAIVLLDLDALVLQPFDTILDLILDRTLPANASHHLMWPDRPLPDDIQVLYTIDYAMVGPERRVKPVQGGFAVLRPNRTLYEEFVAIVRKGDFRERGGWGGKSGKFWGGQTFQGLMAYKYQVLNPESAVELNWCTYNNMGSPSRDDGLVNDTANGKCCTNTPTCEDCRSRNIDQVISTHFTVCQKPWLCFRFNKNTLTQRFCQQAHNAWFRARSDMEKTWGRSGWGEGQFDREHSYGYCNRFGGKGYSLIEEPYGVPLS